MGKRGRERESFWIEQSTQLRIFPVNLHCCSNGNVIVLKFLQAKEQRIMNRRLADQWSVIYDKTEKRGKERENCETIRKERLFGHR